MPTQRLNRVIQTLRESKKPPMTQRDLARRAKVTPGYIAQLEMGLRKKPSVAVLQRLAKALGVQPSTLGIRETMSGRSHEHLIRPCSEESPDGKWHPKARVFWNEGDTTQEQEMTWRAVFSNRDEADRYALGRATAWIAERLRA